jgi:cation diffusion facilitator CzcD-associated flavoprotein CzcO
MRGRSRRHGGCSKPRGRRARPEEPDVATRATDLLIVGAGPFGLAAAARCITRGVPYTLLGDPLSFWTQHMPQGMYLRSPYAWHLCPDGELSFERYLEEEGLGAVGPIMLARFLDYGRWFVRRRGIEVTPARVAHLDQTRGPGQFVAELEDGGRVAGRHVLCAPGLAYFRNAPEWLWAQVAPEYCVHITEVLNPGPSEFLQPAKPSEGKTTQLGFTE